MKTQQLSTFILLLFFSTLARAQHKTYSALEGRQAQHDMTADKDDAWTYAGGKWLGGDHPAEYEVWIKTRATDDLHYYSSISPGPVDKVVTGQLFNADKLELATTTITSKNAAGYVYRVLTNDGIVLQPWATPTVFRQNKFTAYAYLGKFDCRRTTIRLEMAKKSDMQAQSLYFYNSDDLQPLPIDMIFKQYQNGALTAVSKQEWEKGFIVDPVSKMEQINIKITALPKLEMYHVYLKQDFKGKITYQPIGNNWEHSFRDDAQIKINSLYFSRPGKYTIIIRPEMTIGDGKSVTVGKEVKAFFIVPPGPFTIPVKTGAFIVLIIVTTGGFMFMMYRRDQKRRLSREAKDRQIATLQLASVRAQLNPHFIFNALAGIQNLMNKNDVENANKYLSRFARLTRNILDDGDKELTTIEKEISLLNDYLQMEQTRFGFNFSIDVDNNQIDQQIEIPAMLLQPFVENAVKHGVSALKDQGMIKVGIAQKGNSLILTVQDNGKGFGSNVQPGTGTKLCRDRIALLNSIYKNTTILLQQTSGSDGAVISIELKGWV